MILHNALSYIRIGALLMLVGLKFSFSQIPSEIIGYQNICVVATKLGDMNSIVAENRFHIDSLKNIESGITNNWYYKRGYIFKTPFSNDTNIVSGDTVFSSEYTQSDTTIFNNGRIISTTALYPHSRWEMKYDEDSLVIAKSDGSRESVWISVDSLYELKTGLTCKRSMNKCICVREYNVYEYIWTDAFYDVLLNGAESMRYYYSYGSKPVKAMSPISMLDRISKKYQYYDLQGRRINYRKWPN
jgi:hypothetical protein